MSSVGILLLSHVQKIYPLSPDQSIVGLLTSLVSFSDLNDPWTCTRAREQARSLVEYYVGHRELSTLLTQLLQERVKPLFARSKNPAITQQGRKAIDPLPSNATAHSGLDAETKPWKYRDVYIVTVFQWILTRLTVRIISDIQNGPALLTIRTAIVSRGKLAPRYPSFACTDR